jgi:hypothetical protein
VVKPPASAPSATQPAIFNLEVMASIALLNQHRRLSAQPAQ